MEAYIGKAAGVYSRDGEQPAVKDGLFSIEAEFVTEHLVIRGEISGPEARLSDYLNTSAASVEIRPRSVEYFYTSDQVDLSNTHAQITKAHLLFIIPVSEPERPARGDVTSWTRTTTKVCWASLGRFGVSGKIHIEPSRDPRRVLRSLEQKQFLAFTDVTITYPDGSTESHGTAIVNRAHVEMLALRDY